MVSQLPRVSDRVWDLLERMRTAIGRVAPYNSGPDPDRTVMQRPVYDESRRGVFSSTPGLPVTPVYGAEEYRALNDLIAPGPRRRLNRLLGRADREWHDNKWIWRSTLVGSLRAAAQLAEATPQRRDGKLADRTPEPVTPSGITQAMAGAWTAVHFDQVLDDLESGGRIPRGTATELALGWPDPADTEAAAAARQKLLHDVDPMAPGGYAFAEAVGSRTGMSPEQVLHRLNNAPVRVAPQTAAALLMGSSERLVDLAQNHPLRYAEWEEQVAASIEVDFNRLRDRWETGMGPRYRVDPVEESTVTGRWVAERAIERMDHLISTLDQPVTEPQTAEIQHDPRTGTANPSSVASLAHDYGEAVTGVTKQGKGIDGRS